MRGSVLTSGKTTSALGLALLAAGMGNTGVEAQDVTIRRAIPAAVSPPIDYQRAVERGWRSADVERIWNAVVDVKLVANAREPFYWRWPAQKPDMQTTDKP
jgi:hypothetical protein